MYIRLIKAIFIAIVVYAVIFSIANTRAMAAVQTFAANPTTNSIDWTNAVNNLGASGIDTITFDDHPLGALQSNFYTASKGVTLTAQGDVNAVLFGTGPANGNTFTGPTSNGEGIHTASNYLNDGVGQSALIIDFASAIWGGGLFIIDYFNPADNNALVLEAYSGVGATGDLLGSTSSAAFNFQNNKLYFMGIASTEKDIRSLRFIDTTSNTGDFIGIDDITFAIPDLDDNSSNDAESVPVPASLLLFLLGMYPLRRHW